MNDKEFQAFLFWFMNEPLPKTREEGDKKLQFMEAQYMKMDNEQLEMVLTIEKLRVSALESELSKTKTASNRQSPETEG